MPSVDYQEELEEMLYQRFVQLMERLAGLPQARLEESWVMQYRQHVEVQGGGRSSQAGALRLAIARALLSFLSEREMENMRQAGLLTPDPRVRERNKPGQEGARRKYTWRKR
ncbi:hypothetical protein CRUP_003504 [Coryphaenoides rupestris]|nr:hypothetical protein CRUP_003504 [Coryphaenoides rupestris]